MILFPLWKIKVKDILLGNQRKTRRSRLLKVAFLFWKGREELLRDQLRVVELSFFGSRKGNTRRWSKKNNVAFKTVGDKTSRFTASNNRLGNALFGCYVKMFLIFVGFARLTIIYLLIFFFRMLFVILLSYLWDLIFIDIGS